MQPTARTLLMLSFLIAPCTAAADIVEQLSARGFTEVDQATVRDWRTNAEHVFTVTAAEPGCLTIDIGPEPTPPDLTWQAGGFSYRGTDRGEWGGELIVTDPDGKQRTLLEDNIHTLLPSHNSLLVFSGLAHMSISRGAIHRVHRADSEPRIERVTLLPDAPRVVVDAPLRGSPRHLIVGMSSLMELSRLGDAYLFEVLLIDQPWHGTYPSSAAALGDQLLIGMFGGIALVELPAFSASTQLPRYFTQPAPAADAPPQPDAANPICVAPY